MGDLRLISIFPSFLAFFPLFLSYQTTPHQITIDRYLPVGCWLGLAWLDLALSSPPFSPSIKLRIALLLLLLVPLMFFCFSCKVCWGWMGGGSGRGHGGLGMWGWGDGVGLGW